MSNKNLKFERTQFKVRLFADILAILGSWFLSYYVRFDVLHGGPSIYPNVFFIMAAPVLIAGLLLNFFNGLYSSELEQSWKNELSALVKSSIEEFLLFTVVYYFLFDEKVSRLHLVLFYVLLFLFFVLFRGLSNKYIASRIGKGLFKERVLLVGYGDKLLNCYESSVNGKAGRLEIVGQIFGKDQPIEGLQQINSDSVIDAIKEHEIDTVLVSFPTEKRDVQNRIMSQCLDLTEQRVFSILSLPKSYIGSNITEYRGTPIIQLNSEGFSMGARFVKRTMDLIMCIVGIAVTLPFMIIFALIIKLTSKGPVFFKQKRVTRDGKVFNMYKFRSMRTDMAEGEAHWTEENDPRITKFGKFLRKTSLDELPQLFNVLGGSMSMIGPRPERPELEEQFVNEIPGYNIRHRMKAGISGWAQVNGLRGNTSLVKRIDYDLFYIRNWSVKMDIKIIVMTFFHGFINKNAY